MTWSLLFALFLVAVVILKYWQPWAARCPECGAYRQDDAPLCSRCGWIYQAPEDDLDYGEEPEQADPDWL